MQIRVSHVVGDVDPDAAAAWWSDFRDGRDDHAILPGHTRRIVSRSADNVVMEDETTVLGRPIFRERTTAWPEARRVRFSGRNTFGLFDGEYAFEPARKGTRIVLEATVTLEPRLRWGDVAGKPLALAILRADLAWHAKEMRSDLRARRQVSPWRGA